MISIVGGRFRGRTLGVPSGKNVRPTTNKVRGAIFNVLNNWLHFEEMLVIDLYAGSGALGLEAISRRADTAFFIESSSSNLKGLKENISLFKDETIQSQWVHEKAHKWLPHFRNEGRPCLIFIDPPYQSGEYEEIIPLISRLSTIPPKSILVVESLHDTDYPTPSLTLLQTKRYGQIKVNFFEKSLTCDGTQSDMEPQSSFALC